MFFLIGLVTVTACVLGGFLAAGGHIHVLWQPYEFLIIFGTALGAFIIANPKRVLAATAKSFGKLFKGPRYTKASYLDLLSLLYALFKLARSKGDLALESHLDRPDQSQLFLNYPSVSRNGHAVEFLCDYLRLLTLGNPPAHEVETVMEADLEIHHSETMAAAQALQTVADALPALGIVAAVLGVIHTMGSITEPPEVLGHLIGGALVGTFSGVLASYGIFAPMAKSLETTSQAESRFVQCIRMGVIAHMQGYAPQISVEFARKALNSETRPSFRELEEAIQNVKS